jgi:hypothetical protein
MGSFFFADLADIKLLKFVVFILICVLLRKFREPTRSYRRILLPFTIFEIVLHVLFVVVAFVTPFGNLRLLKTLRLLEAIFFPYVIYVMCKVRGANQADDLMFSLIGTPNPAAVQPSVELKNTAQPATAENIVNLTKTANT